MGGRVSIWARCLATIEMRGHRYRKSRSTILIYNTKDLTESGKSQLASLQFLDGQMQKIRQEIAVYQTAQAAYAQALKAEIAKAGHEPLQ